MTEPTLEQLGNLVEALASVMLAELVCFDHLSAETAQERLRDLAQTDALLCESILTRHSARGTPVTGKIIRLAAIGCLMDRARGLPIAAPRKG